MDSKNSSTKPVISNLLRFFSMRFAMQTLCTIHPHLGKQAFHVFLYCATVFSAFGQALDRLVTVS